MARVGQQLGRCDLSNVVAQVGVLSRVRQPLRPVALQRLKTDTQDIAATRAYVRSTQRLQHRSVVARTRVAAVHRHWLPGRAVDKNNVGCRVAHCFAWVYETDIDAGLQPSAVEQCAHVRVQYTIRQLVAVHSDLAGARAAEDVGREQRLSYLKPLFSDVVVRGKCLTERTQELVCISRLFTQLSCTEVTLSLEQPKGILLLL